MAIDLEQQREKLLPRFPSAGRLVVDFRSQRRPPEDTKALSKKDFYKMWTQCALQGLCFRLCMPFARVTRLKCAAQLKLRADTKGMQWVSV